MEKKEQVLLIHGGDTHLNYEEYLQSLKQKNIHLEWLVCKRDWKNELQFQLWDEYVVYTPQMPNKQNAQYEEWCILFEKLVNALDDNFILVGHSLWAAFIVKYLSENKIDKKIKKLHLLGTPFDENMDSDKLVGFRRKGSLLQLKEQVWELFFYHSKDDFAVPYGHFLKYQEALLDAKFRSFEDRNHFLQWEISELNRDIIS